MNLNNIIFLDIETVPLTETQNELPPALAELWADKCDQLRKRSPERYGTDDNADEMFHEAGIFAEFGKIVCISVGFIHQKAGKNCFRVKSFYGNDEHKLLTEFADLLNNFHRQQILRHPSGRPQIGAPTSYLGQIREDGYSVKGRYQHRQHSR